VVDGNMRKNICSLLFSRKKKKIAIGSEEFELEKIEDVLALKKNLVESALQHFE
jgi:hypothetical protein